MAGCEQQVDGFCFAGSHKLDSCIVRVMYYFDRSKVKTSDDQDNK